MRLQKQSVIKKKIDLVFTEKNLQNYCKTLIQKQSVLFGFNLAPDHDSRSLEYKGKIAKFDRKINLYTRFVQRACPLYMSTSFARTGKNAAYKYYATYQHVQDSNVVAAHLSGICQHTDDRSLI